jgi:hypothetical protein
MNGEVTRTRARRSVLEPVLATAVTACALAAIWLVAVPRPVVCPAVSPPLPGCTPEHRTATGTVWTAVLLLVWVVTLVVARLRRGVLPSLLVALTVALALAAYVGTEFSTGFATALGDGAPTLGT